MALRIDDDVLDVLRCVHCEGNAAKIVQQLERKMYLKVNKVLEALGGKWNRKAKAHVFTLFGSNEPAVAAEIIGDAVTAGEYVDAKKQYDFFETPEELIVRMLRYLNVEPGKLYLEPSAGLGAIARRVRDAGGDCMCIEINEKMADQLLKDDFAVYCEDFVEFPLPAVGKMKESGKEERLIDERVDGVIMNPPFSRSQDIDHVLRAYKWLKPGGRLVAIMGAGWRFRSDRKATGFRVWLDQRCAEPYVEDLPAGTFKGSGTMVHSTLVVIDKGKDEE